MTRDDIIRMAREAGLHLATDVNWMPVISIEYAEKFAALVAAAEREACAALVEANAMACHSTIYGSLLQSNADAIRAHGQDPMPLFDDWNKDWTK